MRKTGSTLSQSLETRTRRTNSQAPRMPRRTDSLPAQENVAGRTVRGLRALFETLGVIDGRSRRGRRGGKSRDIAASGRRGDGPADARSGRRRGDAVGRAAAPGHRHPGAHDARQCALVFAAIRAGARLPRDRARWWPAPRTDILPRRATGAVLSPTSCQGSLSAEWLDQTDKRVLPCHPTWR
jgi:hypothetical protein